MSAPGAGVLLALSGDDAEILRALSQAGSGLCVVRRCADLPELLSAGMAGLAGFALLDTGFDEIDRTVLDRLARAGLSGMLLVEAHEEERWLSAGWPVLRRDTEPGRICAALQDLVRRGGASGAASTGTGPAAGSADWLSAATPASTEANTEPNAAAQETAWLEELWRQSPGSPEGGTAPSQPPRASNDAGDGTDTGQNRRRGRETAAADTPEPVLPVAASPAAWREDRSGVGASWCSRTLDGRRLPRSRPGRLRRCDPRGRRRRGAQPRPAPRHAGGLLGSGRSRPSGHPWPP